MRIIHLTPCQRMVELHLSLLHSSRGLGRVPLKDKTRVRIPYGAKKPVDKFSAGFLYSIGCL